MQGLLGDVNVQGHMAYLRRRIEAIGLLTILDGIGLRIVTFRDLALPPELDDRSLWKFCQSEGWVLLTDNRNQAGDDSLQATLSTSWQPGDLPVLTLSNKQRFEEDRDYTDRVAAEVADILFDLHTGADRPSQPRIYVPSRWP